MFWSFLSRCNPPREVRLDNHKSPSVIGSPPGLAFDKDNAPALASSDNKAMTTKKDKNKTAQEEKKMPAAGKKKTSCKCLETDSKSSNSTVFSREGQETGGILCSGRGKDSPMGGGARTGWILYISQ